MSHFIASMVHPANRPLGQAMLRTAGIVQAIVALPCALYLAGSAYNYFGHCYDKWYYFTTSVIACAVTTGIVYVAGVQQRISTTSRQAFVLEAVKTGLATLMFTWVNLEYDFNLKRLIVTLLAVDVLFAVPLMYAYTAWKEDKREERSDIEGNRREVDDKSPLLQG